MHSKNYRLHSLAQLCQTIDKILCVVGNAVLGCHRPEMDNISIISERQYSGPGDVLLEERLQPKDPGFLVGPCCFSIAGKAVDEHDASSWLVVTDLVPAPDYTAPAVS